MSDSTHTECQETNSELESKRLRTQLAQIERQVRELADEAQQIGDEPSTAQGDAPDLARLQVHRHYARKLRAIVDPPEDT